MELGDDISTENTNSGEQETVLIDSGAPDVNDLKLIRRFHVVINIRL
jgi:hypothetical protein